MIEKIFYLALVCSLITQFIYATFWEGMIFGNVAGWLMSVRTTKDGKAKVKDGRAINRLPLWIRKPLFECPICMTPYYSTIILFVGIWSGYLTISIFQFILVIFTASGISTIFSRFYE